MIKKINNYQILSKIASGGMSEVYLAVDTETGKKVALKILDAKLSIDPKYLHRFKKEASICQQLDHKNIVKILSYGTFEESYYIAYEYIEGITLDKLLRQKDLTIAQIEKISIQLLAGLSYAHSKNIIHRDIKPSNIIIEKGVVKILDFGIAKQELAATVTKSGLFMGSPHYVSPEQIEGHDIDYRSDIYSFGIVLYEMIEGRVPFSADTPWGIIRAHLDKKAPEITKDTPSYLKEVVLKCLSKRKEDRFKSANEIISVIVNKEEIGKRTVIIDKENGTRIFVADNQNFTNEKNSAQAKNKVKRASLKPIFISLSVVMAVVISVIIIIISITITLNSNYVPAQENTSTSVVQETTTETTAGTISKTTTIATTVITTETETMLNEAPTMKLSIIEGPVSAENGSICYYRVKATVKGNPVPEIIWSKDDSSGAFGNTIAQVNLKDGESYILNASAENVAGKVSKSLELKWGNSLETVAETTATETTVTAFTETTAAGTIASTDKNEEKFLNNMSSLLNEYNLAFNHMNTYHKEGWIYNNPKEIALEETFLIKLLELSNELENFPYPGSLIEGRGNLVNISKQLCDIKASMINCMKNNDYSGCLNYFNNFWNTVDQLWNNYNEIVAMHNKKYH